MKTNLITLLVVTFLITSCSEDSNPDGGEMYFELKFSEEVNDPDVTISQINFSLAGGLYSVNSGRSLTTDPFFVNKNENVQYVIDGSNHWGCVPSSLKAIFRGKEIFRKDYSIGLDCEGVRFDVDALISGNVIIPG
jgi:hypothetical protein